jgi:hypothetical protein
VRVVRWRPWLIAAAAYTVITVPFVSPLTNYRHLSTASYEGDSRLLIWTLAWDSHAVLSGAPLFDANIFYPLAGALAQAEHHIGIALFALPFYAASGNPVLTYWIVWLLAFPLNAVAMHALAWRVTRDHLASFVGGVVYAFCFFRMHHAHGHLQLMWTWALPLVPLALERWLAQPTWPRASLVAGLVLVQALSSWYLAVFVAILGVVSTVLLVPGTRLRRAHVAQALTAFVCTAMVIAWFAMPYFRLATGPVDEIAANAADVKGYLVPPEHTWLGQWLLRNTAVRPRWIWGEQTLYVGMTTFAMACIGAWRMRKRKADRVLAAVLITGLFAFTLSFGPSSFGLTPFDLFSSLPGMDLLRAPARFALLVMMGMALLAAIGTSGMKSRAIVGLLVAAVLGESFVVNFPSGKPQPFPTPMVYEQLASRPAGALLSLPTYRGTPEAFRETDYLLFATRHWRPIVNGFGRQEPPSHSRRMDVLGRFPQSEAVELMRSLGIRHAILHTRRASELADRVRQASESNALRLITAAEGDFLFEIVR